MTECNNGDVRDLLPDHLSGALTLAGRMRVDAHLAACAACRDELALLRLARAVRPRAADIDVARIVAALPRPGAKPSLQLVRDDVPAPSRTGLREPATVAGVLPSMRAARPVRRTAWRLAAAIGVTVLGSWSVLSVRDGLPGSATAGGVQVAAETSSPSGDASALPLGETTASRVPPGESEPSGAAAEARLSRAGAPGGALSLGDLSDYTDEDLEHVLDRLEKWDGATSADPLPTVPIVSVTARGTL